METNALEERFRFICDLQSGRWSMSELCERFGISRPTGYKWLARSRESGGSLEDRSRAPHRCPHRTSDGIEELLLAARRRYGWGAKKLRNVLSVRHPQLVWPARSTINDVLDRHGLLRKKRRRKKWNHPGVAPLTTAGPNQIWPADFKGHFKLGGNGQYCYPLTITDHFSRSLLACRGLKSTTMNDSWPVFRALFREVGLPVAIRTDNGAPFASTGIHGLCWLNVKWLQLGIVHQRIHPASPQENGTHERMHRELKRETARPAASSMRSQQSRFDAFRRRYNEERPHEGIGDRVPASLWAASPRRYPEKTPRPEYDADMAVRLVSSVGTFWFRDKHVFLSKALTGERVGLKEVDDGVWDIVYYRTLIGRIDERTRQITGV